jgi:hypothetical protein
MRKDYNMSYLPDWLVIPSEARDLGVCPQR